MTGRFNDRSGMIIALLIAAFFGLLTAAAPRALGAESPKGLPVTVIADKLDYDRVNDIYTAIGHVKIEQAGIRLEADKVVLNNKTGDALAEGNVLLQDKDDVTRADNVQININTRAGVMYNGTIFRKKENLHVKGDVIERRSETVYHIKKGCITTCDDNEWYLKADELNVDMDRYATARGVSFNLLGVPALYSPYLLFPVKRQTGFLIPSAGNSSFDGLTVENAFFWAISDYKDLTLYSDYRSDTGHGTGLEYRYMNSFESWGQVYGKFWNMFRTRAYRESPARFNHPTDESRWELRVQHQEEFADDLSARIDINQVSDEHYYHDLDKLLEMKSKPYIDSNAFYVERWNTAALYVLGQYSTDLTRPNRNTIQKLPEIRYQIFEEPLVGPLHLNFEASAVNFTRQAGEGMRRADFNPQLSMPLGSNGLTLTPRIGARATFYDRSDPNAETNKPTERSYIYTGADLTARLSRVYGDDAQEGIGKVRHSIEPMVSYMYIPHVAQGDIPRFDATDSVVSMNTLTVSLINRVTAHYKESKDAARTSFDLVVFRLFHGYNLTAAEGSGVTGSARHYSDLQADLALQAPKYFSLTASATYNPDTGHLPGYTLNSAFTSSEVNLNLSYQNAREAATPAEYIITGGSFKLRNWEFGAQWWLDLQNHIWTQEEYRLRYASQCWGVNVILTHTPGETRVVATLDLKGFGNLGK